MNHASIQASIAAPRSAPQPLGAKAAELLDPFRRLAGDLSNAHVLIVAEHGLDLMCGLIRRGCLAATVLRAGDKPDADDYEVVFVPCVAELASCDAVVRLARMALAPNGRLIAGVNQATEAAALTYRLRLNGFPAVRSLRSPKSMLLSADLRRLS